MGQALRLALIAAALTAMAPCTQASPADDFARPVELAPPGGALTDGIEMLGALQLDTRAPDGMPVTGLSGLAWDEDEQRLYAVSDRGRLLHLAPVFGDGRLVSLDYLASYPLRDAHGAALSGSLQDAEDIALENANNGIRGDTRLWISFERRPRVVRYTPEGRYRERARMPPGLDDPASYATSNQALESLVLHPSRGLLTASERPMEDDPPHEVSVRGLEGGRWQYPLASAPGSSLVALEILPGGGLVALERAFLSVFMPLVISLSAAELDDEGGVRVKRLARLDTSRGWQLDNFEGLARHERDRFFIVSDDNGREAQRTLLVYLRLPELSAD